MSMLNELKPNSDSKKNRKRVGRGIASGTGKTCGRGHRRCRNLQPAKDSQEG